MVDEKQFDLETIEDMFMEFSRTVVHTKWDVTREQNYLSIFKSEEYNVIVEIGYIEEDNDVLLKVYEYPVVENVEVYLDTRVDVNDPRNSLGRNPTSVVENQSMTIMGALSKAIEK